MIGIVCGYGLNAKGIATVYYMWYFSYVSASTFSTMLCLQFLVYIDERWVHLACRNPFSTGLQEGAVPLFFTKWSIEALVLALHGFVLRLSGISFCGPLWKVIPSKTLEAKTSLQRLWTKNCHSSFVLTPVVLSFCAWQKDTEAWQVLAALWLRSYLEMPVLNGLCFPMKSV